MIKSIASEGIREAASQIFWSWGWPVMLPIISGALLWLQGSPVGYIFIGMVMTFAFTAFGLFWFSRWSYYRSSEWKLSFAEGQVLWDGNGTDQLNIRIGIILRSSAEFPIIFKMEEIKTSLGNSFNPSPQYPTKIITVPPHGDAFYYDDVIQVASASVSAGIDGKISYKIKYGAENSTRKYEMIKSHRCHLFSDENNMTKCIFTDVDPELDGHHLTS